METREPITMESTIRREAVRFAIQTYLFCNTCDGILDLPAAVLLTAKPEVAARAKAEGKPSGSILCGDCWKDLQPKLSAGWGEIFDIWTGKGAEIMEGAEA